MHHLETVRYEDFTFWHFVMPFWKNFTQGTSECIFHFSIFFNPTNYRCPFSMVKLDVLFRVYLPWSLRVRNMGNIISHEITIPINQPGFHGNLIWRFSPKRTSWWTSRFGSARPSSVFAVHEIKKKNTRFLLGGNQKLRAFRNCTSPGFFCSWFNWYFTYVKK